MDELTWNNSIYLYRMLKVCCISKRKGRLLGCAIFRKNWNKLDEKCRTAVKIAELYADGKITDKELAKIRNSILITDSITGAVSTLVSPFNYSSTPWFATMFARPFGQTECCDMLRHMVKYKENQNGLVDV